MGQAYIESHMYVNKGSAACPLFYSSENYWFWLGSVTCKFSLHWFLLIVSEPHQCVEVHNVGFVKHLASLAELFGRLRARRAVLELYWSAASYWSCCKCLPPFFPFTDHWSAELRVRFPKGCWAVLLDGDLSMSLHFILCSCITLGNRGAISLLKFCLVLKRL